MQRLFSMFPRGLPGLALLLLRASVVIALLDQDYRHWAELPVWMLAASMLISVALTAGFLTPIFAATALVFHVLVWSMLGAASAEVAIVLALDALTLALLGPGAYSIDSYRFGQRVVVLPPP